jgi:hypothetical protein
VTESTDVLLRVRSIDPTWVTEEDHVWQAAAGLNWAIKTREQSLLSLAAVWEMDLPEDASAAIEHEAALQLRARF